VPFIRREKFQGENPYKLGQSIKDDFDFYTTELSGVHKLIDANKEEYRALRISDFESSVSEFLHLINAIRAKELEFADLVQEACKRYCQLRRQEYDQVKELILAHIDKIEKFSGDITNAENSLPKRRNSGLFMYLKLLFSSDYRRNERLRRSLGTEWTQLKKLVSRSEHLKSLQISFNSEDVFLSARSLMELINVEDERFDLKMQQEFNGFGLNYDLAVEDSGFQKIKTYVDQSNSLRSSNLVDILQGIEDSVQDVKALLQRLYHALEAHSDIAVNYKLEGTLNENKRNLNEIERLLENKRLEIPKQIDHECQNLDLLKSHSSGFVLTSLPKLHQKVSALVARFRSDGWTSFEIKSEDIHEIIADFTKQIECKNTYFNSRDNRFIIEYRWFHYYNNLSEVDRELVGQLKRSNNWRSSFLISYLNNLLLRNSTMELPVDDRDHFILRDKLTSLGNEQLKFIKQFWFSKQIDAARDFVRKNQGITIENLYNKRSSRNFRRLSLRQIVRKDPNLFTTFFPIVLTTPDVASNLFKGHNRFFDIVMFDEASQLRLEDNLPALLKGKQVIIAGDEHQMPPSNYFSKVFDGSIEDEDQMEEEEIENNAAVGKHEFLLSCESLLEFGNELNFQKTFLDFHYRSRHPFLIDFSNSAFYNQRLKPLPNNLEYTSINYIQVNGTFSEHTNEAEANMVIHILENVIRRFPNGNYPTVGVATFNIAQRNLIKSKIADKIIQERTGSFGDKIRELEEAGLFVKNLENIQGDERDVIILSTTYGIGKDGKFAQRFGPINHSKGYRLLNVIITRAKYKVYCCTSIPEKYFVHYKDFLVTEGANNRRAVLYAYLAYCKAVSEGNLTERTAILEALSDNSDSESEFNPALFGELESPFEEEVYEAIVDHLGSEHIIPQMRFAGFRIDLVYESPILGVPKIAIECDGAKYHSSREAYVYDTHRQKILEGHGFVFHRIWSTNWWRDAKRETEQLIDFIRKVEGNPRVDTHKHDLKALAFADVDVAINRQFNVKAEIDLIADLSIIKSFQSAETDQLVKSEATVVKVDSIVHVKYMNNGKELAVHLVPTENNKIIKGQPQKVFYKSALAVSLIGATVGDVVKVGSLDNFVQIIGIDN
jgi:very-short-patch-repair endonuclease/transcription elongation GreA/GreB family factor